jgi:hypothetical protein
MSQKMEDRTFQIDSGYTSFCELGDDVHDLRSESEASECLYLAIHAVIDQRSTIDEAGHVSPWQDDEFQVH